MSDDDIIAQLEASLAADEAAEEIPDAELDDSVAFDADDVFSPNDDGSFTLQVTAQVRHVLVELVEARIAELRDAAGPVAYAEDPLAQLAYEMGSGALVADARIADLSAVADAARSGRVGHPDDLWCWARAMNGLRLRYAETFPQLIDDAPVVCEDVSEYMRLRVAAAQFSLFGMFQYAAIELAD